MTYFRGGVPGCVTKCDSGRGSKLAKNWVTYFMDGPLGPIYGHVDAVQLGILLQLDRGLTIVIKCGT